MSEQFPTNLRARSPTRLVRDRQEALKIMREQSAEQLIAECDVLLNQPPAFTPGPRSFSLLTLLRERLVAEAQSHDRANVSKVSERGTVAYQLHLRNPHLEVGTARYYVDAICEEFAKLPPKEQS